MIAGDNVLVQATLIGAIAVVVVAPLAFRVARARFDPFEPIVLFAVAYGIMFVVRPAAMIAGDSLVYVGPRGTLDVSGSFTEMLSLALVGAIAFVVGYVVPLGGRWVAARRHPHRDLDLRRLVVATGVIALVGLCSFVFLIASSEGISVLKDFYRAGNTALPVSGASNYASYGFLAVVPATLILLAVGLERRSKALLIASFCLGAVFLMQSVPTGSRIALLPLLGGVFVLSYIRRGARPSVATILLVGAVAVLVSTFLSDLRGRTTRGETVADTLVRSTSPSRLASSFTSGPDSEMAPVLSAALAVIPEQLPHTYGKTIVGDLVVRPIPRALWQDKPLLPRQRLVATIWPVEYERGTINPEFSVLLYFYWDFGLLGIIGGLAAYGLLARCLYEYLLRGHEYLSVQVFYSLAVWFVVIGLRDSPVDTFVRAVFVLGPAWIIFLIARSTLGLRRARLRESVSPDPRTVP